MQSPSHQTVDDTRVALLKLEQRVSRLESALEQQGGFSTAAPRREATRPAAWAEATPLVEVLSLIDNNIKRIADHLVPPPTDKVGSPYIAERLGQTTTWVAEMARKGIIPKSCLVPGTGTGKPWKFYRTQIDEWLETR